MTQALILVGGQGTRLRPLTFNINKSMVPILNRPFLEHLLGYLKRHGVREVILATSYRPDVIRNHFGDGSGLGIKLDYVIEDSPLGTAGAVKNAEALIHEQFFVLNGDIITEIDLGAMLKEHQTVKPKASIALTPVDNPTLYGVIETDGRGMVKRFVEKPPLAEVTTNMINAGVYILEPEVLDCIPRSTFSMFERDIFPLLLKKDEPVMGFPSDSYWIDIGTPEKYLKANHDLLRSQYVDKVRAGAGCRIDPAAVIKGPVEIAGECVIGRGAKIIGPAVIGPRCEIGEEAVIEGAVLWNDSTVGKQAVLRNCIAGALSSARDHSEIAEGCILGDHITVGEGSKLAPGTRIWSDRIRETNGG